MNYTLWEDSEGNVHEISEMSTKYIKNCIKCIENTNYNIYTKESAKKDKTHNIFGPWWCYENAQNFLNAFESELNIRKRGKEKDYPSFTLDESCENCNKFTCEENELCDHWMVNRMEIFHQFSGEDLEVARRFGYFCNSVRYEYEE